MFYMKQESGDTRAPGRELGRDALSGSAEEAGRAAASALRERRERGQRRQRARRLLPLATFLLFPIIIFYFSPVLIIEGALSGVVAASMLVFGLQFLLSLIHI